MEIIIHSWEEFRDHWKHSDPLFVSSSETYPIASVGQIHTDKFRATLLLSRLPVRIDSSEPWLSAVKDGINHVRSQGWSLISSNGMTGWEYIAWYAAKLSVPLIVILMPEKLSSMTHTVNRLITQLSLKPETTTFVMPILEGKSSKKERCLLRDRLAFHLADYRLPIAIRPDGRWEQMISDSKNVIDRFQVTYPQVRKFSWSEKLKGITISQNPKWNELLFHWTRGSYGPWIGETDADYFEALTDNKFGNPRDGQSTLQQIVKSGVLRGQERMIRVKQPMISFTTITPALIHDYIHYRHTLKHLTYEPYGIAIPKIVLKKFGARSVIYGDDDLYNSLPTSDRPYFQFKGSKTIDWRREDEWRLFGDIDLHSIKEQLHLITVTEHEAIQLRQNTHFRVESIETMN